MSRRGFTFVEMSAIIVVLAIFAGLVVPNMLASRRGQGERLLYTQLPGFVERARTEALTRKATIRLAYDASGRALTIDMDDDTQRGDDPIARLALPDGVSAARFVLNGSDSGESDWAVRFFGDGTAEASTVEFSGMAKSSCLVIDARKGRGEVRDGSISDQSDEQWGAGELEKRA